MEFHTLILLACSIATVAAWSRPFYPVPRAPIRITRFAPHPHRIPLRPEHLDENYEYQQRPKRNHHDDYSEDDNFEHRDNKGVTGPIHTFVKTDKNANYKWGVRHHVGNKYAS